MYEKGQDMQKIRISTDSTAHIPRELREAVNAALEQPPEFEYPVGCIIGINTGPDMIGLIYRT